MLNADSCVSERMRALTPMSFRLIRIQSNVQCYGLVALTLELGDILDLSIEYGKMRMYVTGHCSM